MGGIKRFPMTWALRQEKNERTSSEGAWHRKGISTGKKKLVK